MRSFWAFEDRYVATGVATPTAFGRRTVLRTPALTCTDTSDRPSASREHGRTGLARCGVAPIAPEAAQTRWSSVRRKRRIWPYCQVDGPLQPPDLRCPHSQSSTPATPRRQSPAVATRVATEQAQTSAEPHAVTARPAPMRGTNQRTVRFSSGRPRIYRSFVRTSASGGDTIHGLTNRDLRQHLATLLSPSPSTAMERMCAPVTAARPALTRVPSRLLRTGSAKLTDRPSDPLLLRRSADAAVKQLIHSRWIRSLMTCVSKT